MDGLCVCLRPVSESERQRARNGASEIFPASERQYIRASRSERNLEWRVIFRFIELCNGVAMSVASRKQSEHMGTQFQSSFRCFNTSTQETLVVSGLPAVCVTRSTAFQTGPVRDSTCVHV